MKDQIEDNADLLDERMISLDLRSLRCTHAGKYLENRAVEELNRAINVFLNATYSDLSEAAPRIRDAHFAARVALEVKSWIQEGIDRGHEAETQLEHEHEPA